VKFRQVEPTAITMTPIGGLIHVGDLAGDEIAVFGDDDIRLAADNQGYPVVPDENERALSRWVAEHSNPGMFEVVGTWISGNELNQGTMATGALDNYLLLTDTYIRGAVPPRGSARVQTNVGAHNVATGQVYLFAIPLVDIEIIDGNKRDIAIADSMEGLMAKWIRSCDANWTKISAGGPWHKDNAPFAQAVLEATIAAKLKHSDEKVRTSAARARGADRSKAYATGRRTTFEFATP
jgi:hypothetical protein